MSSTLALLPRPEVAPTVAALEKVRAQLAQVQTLQEARHVYAVAKAATIYAAEHNLSQDIKQKARAISFEAWCRFGQLWRVAQKNVGTRGQLVGPGIIGCADQELPIAAPPTLEELGLSRKMAAMAVMLTRLSEADFAQLRDGLISLNKLRASRPDIFGLNWRQIWRGMPAYGHQDLMPEQSLTVHFETVAHREAFAKLIDQKIHAATKYVWYPPQDIRRTANKRWATARPVALRYPVYVPTKGRWKTPQTIRALEKINVPYIAVVQPQEYDHYKHVVKTGQILVLPEGLDGIVPTRNFIFEHAIASGAKRHWQIDDNITEFGRFKDNLKITVTSGAIFSAMEDFADRYENVAIAGPHYYKFAPARKGAEISPITMNTRVYSCSLINNEIPYRYRGIYNEDTDICLRALKDEWCVVLFNAFLCRKTVTMTLKGGNTPLYEGDGRLKMAESLRQQHPDVVTVTKKWDRWQHHVDYRKFGSNPLILRPEVVIPDAPNEYGMTLVAAPSDEQAAMANAHDAEAGR